MSASVPLPLLVRLPEAAAEVPLSVSTVAADSTRMPLLVELASVKLRLLEALAPV